jgi:hypothetical protein
MVFYGVRLLKNKILLGESVELWMALWTMGYNHNLHRDEAFNFKVNLKTYLFS